MCCHLKFDVADSNDHLVRDWHSGGGVLAVAAQQAQAQRPRCQTEIRIPVLGMAFNVRELIPHL